MAGINVRVVPIVGFLAGLAPLFFGPFDLIANFKAGVGTGLKALEGNFRAGWTVILGAPIAASLVAGVGRSIGNPGFKLGKLSVRSF